MGNVELATADCFHVRECGPNKVFDTRILGCAHRCCCLRKFVGFFFLEKIGNEKDAVCAFECGLEGFRTVEIRFDDFVCESAVLAWIASQSAHLELALGLQSAHDCAPLLPRCADHGDQFLAVR